MRSADFLILTPALAQAATAVAVRAAWLLPNGSKWPGHSRGRAPACRAPPRAL